MSHFGYNDPDPYGAPVLYYYRVVQKSKGPQAEPSLCRS